jgi:hypothetical protein
MQDEVYSSLCARRPQLRRQWETLLRTERASSPLANPEALVFMMDWTLGQVFEALKATPGRLHAAQPRPECTCGLNPLLVYFRTMEQVLNEGLVLTQVDISHGPAGCHETDLALLKRAIEQVAGREIGVFCALCQHNKHARPSAAASVH